MPTPITLEQLRAVAAALGLEGAPIRTLTVDVRNGVTATLLVRDSTGQALVDGDGPLTATIHIPMVSKAQEYIGRPEWCCDRAFETLGTAHATSCTYG